MKLNWSQIVFYYLFDVLLLLLFLFGESFLGIYVMGAFGVFLLCFSNYLDFTRVSLFKKEFLFWLLFIFGLMISSFYTHNLPLTLNAILFYLFSFVVFSFFLLMKRSLFHINFLFWNLILVVLGLGIMSLIFSLWPGLSDNLPGMNLLYATYGHNHYGALMILFIPITWYFLLKNLHDKGKFSFFFFSLVFMVGSLILSFGRVVIFLGLSELIILILITYRVAPWIGGKLKSIFILLLFVMIGTFLLKNAFSVVSYLKEEVKCPAPLYKDKICKNISTDLRFSYWLTATKAIIDNPLAGYGPGTYRLIAEKYKVRPDAGTSYAHSNILQLAAEGGLIFTAPFVLLIVQFLVRSISLFEKNTLIGIERKRITNWRLFVVIGLVASIINSLVDFDWSFVSLFIVNLILFVIVIRGDNNLPNNKVRVSIARLVYFFSLGAVILLMSISIILEFFFWQKKDKVALDFFPYFQSHMQIFLDSDQLNIEEKNVLRDIYKEVPYIYLENSSIGKASEKNGWKKLSQIAPWNFYEKSTTNEIISIESEEFKQELLRTASLYLQAKNYGYIGLVPADQNLSQLANLFADSLLSKGNYKGAAQIYKTAIVFDEWVFNNTYPRFLYDLKTYDQKSSFWDEMGSVSASLYGKHAPIVGGIHFSMLRTALDQRDLDKIEKWHERTLEIVPWDIEEIGKKILPDLQSLTDEYVLAKDFASAERLVKLITVYPNHFSHLQLGNFYLMLGENEKAKQAYKNCAEWWEKNMDEVHEDCQGMSDFKNKSGDEPYWSTSRAIRFY